MRHLLLASLTVSLATALVTAASPPGATAGERGWVSQGSLVDEPRVEVSEGPRPGYSQVIDNSVRDRFDAPGWERRRAGAGLYGKDYYAGGSSAEGPARYKVEVPESGLYSVYARWPARAANGDATRIGVSGASGVRWTEVDQRKDGGMWVRLGSYALEAGDSYEIRVAVGSGGGEAVADAVMVLSGEQANPEAAAGAEAPGGRTFEATASRKKGREVVRKARRHIGTPYVKSPPKACWAFHKEDCSCHTRVVFRKFGKTLPDNPPDQWKRGKRKINKKSKLRPGDLVFFDENRNGKLQPWDHVGIYSGNGYVIHASSYFGEVVESKMRYIKGFWGAKRFKKLRQN